jgi:hypothetical protein
VPQVFSAGSINARKRVVADLLEQGVTSPETAILFEPEQGVEAEYIHSLRKSGALRVTPQGLTYLDVAAFEDYLSARNRRIAGVIGGALAGLFSLLLVSRI